MALQRKEEMSELVTVAGLVATTPRHLVTQDGLPITSFRLAASHRKFDRALNKWIDGETNWFTITAFRQLAINTAGSVSKGERILVTGKLRVRDWDNGERAGTSVEIEADSIGHDLCWGNSAFTRTVLVREAADLPEPSEADSPEADEIEEKELALAK
jgi:single-strand DNA-binding protein